MDADARCAFHQNQPATFTCVRCGNPACALCAALKAGGRCAACAQLVEAPSPQPQARQPQPTEFNALLREAYVLLARVGWPVVGLAVLQAAPEAVAMVLLQVGLGPQAELLRPHDPPIPPLELIEKLSPLLEPMTGQMLALLLLGFVLTGLVSAVLVARFSDALLGRPRPPAEVWRLALGRLPRLLLAQAAVALLQGAALLAFCLPVVPVSALLLAVTPLVVLADARPFAALSRAFDLGRAHLGTLMGLQLMVWGTRQFASSFVGLLAAPLMLSSETGALAATALAQLASALAGTLGYAVMAVVYERLRGAPPSR